MEQSGIMCRGIGILELGTEETSGAKNNLKLQVHCVVESFLAKMDREGKLEKILVE